VMKIDKNEVNILEFIQYKIRNPHIGIEYSEIIGEQSGAGSAINEGSWAPKL
jgi:hypothetical protein